MIKNNKRFTLIELIIVIVVIGILAGMALPKFLGVQRDAKVSAMFRDIDTLEKTIMLYYQDNDTLPLYELDDNNFNVANTLTDTLNRKGDDVSKLKVIDKSKLKNYLSKDTKYGKDKTKDDEYLYSELTGNVYYSAGLQNGKGITYHTYENANEDPVYRDENGNIINNLKNIKFGDILLSSNKNTINENTNNNFTGLIKKDNTLKVEVNGVDVSTQVQIKDINENEIASNSLFKKVKAADEEYNQFTLPVNLNKNIVNNIKIKIPEENKTLTFLISFKQNNSQPIVDILTDLTNITDKTNIKWEYSFLDEDTFPSKILFTLNDIEYNNINEIPTQLQEGTYTIKFKAQDSKGLYSNEIVKTFIVEKEPILKNDISLYLGNTYGGSFEELGTLNKNGEFLVKNQDLLNSTKNSVSINIKYNSSINYSNLENLYLEVTTSKPTKYKNLLVNNGDVYPKENTYKIPLKGITSSTIKTDVMGGRYYQIANVYSYINQTDIYWNFTNFKLVQD